MSSGSSRRRLKPGMTLMEPDGAGVYLLLEREPPSGGERMWRCVVLCPGEEDPYDDGPEQEGSVMTIREPWLKEQAIET